MLDDFVCFFGFCVMFMYFFVKCGFYLVYMSDFEVFCDELVDLYIEWVFRDIYYVYVYVVCYF